MAGLGGEARISARQRNGLLVELGLRVSGRERDGLRLWRSRLQLAVGTTTPLPLGNARATPLWGAAAAITPGFYYRASPALTLRIAVRAELQASALGSGAAARVLAAGVGPPRALFTLGGLEASTGLELTLWIAPPRSTTSRPRSAARAPPHVRYHRR